MNLLTADERRAYSANGSHKQKPPDDSPLQAPSLVELPLVIPPRTTDLGNAERLTAQHGSDLRYIHPWDKWFFFNGRYWELDEAGEVSRRAKQTAKKIFIEAAHADDDGESEQLSKWAKASQSVARIDAMIKLARSEEPLPISHHSLDADPWLLNVDNGTVDLRNGRLKPHDCGDLITKSTKVEYPDEPGLDAVIWCEFLNEIFGGDVELIRRPGGDLGYRQCSAMKAR